MIGAGAFGKNHLRVIHQSEHAALAGVLDLDPERAARAAATHGCRVFTSLEELAAHAAQLPTAAPQDSIDKGVKHKLRRIWKGSQGTDTRSMKSNAGTLSSRERKRDVAAQ